MANEDASIKATVAKLAVFALVVLLLGLPIIRLSSYALLFIAAFLLCLGTVVVQWRRWVIALVIVGLTVVVQYLVAPPKIEEGHNVFVTDDGNGARALETALPADVFQFMKAQFDALYPRNRRCGPQTQLGGCWRAGKFPDRAFAFSSDSIYDAPQFSRRVAAIDFDDPTWLRLGFTNDLSYNWYNHTSDVQRGHRDPRAWIFWHRWRLTMPWFVAYQFPAAFAGSRLCWRGDVLWEQSDGRFSRESHGQVRCRELGAADVGRRIFGVAIVPDSLAMRLEPTAKIRWLGLSREFLTLIAASLIVLLLVRWRPQEIRLPGFLLAISLVLVILSDASLFGGFRYHDGGDDGLVYEGKARWMLQALLKGDVREALRGDADVFYFTPGLRYLRLIERLLFGDTNFGYLSLLLGMPFIVWTLFRRFLTGRWALILTTAFIVTPVGLLFGSNFFLYVQNASRGYADAAAAILFLWGIVMLFKLEDGSAGRQIARGLGAAFLFAIAVQVRPNIAPAAGVLLLVAGSFALWRRQFARFASLCIGFSPVFLCAIHNWYYGGVFVLFSSNATHESVYKATPFDYLAALGELATLRLDGEHLVRATGLVTDLLRGPRELVLMVPLHAAAVAVLVRVALARRFDVTLRLTALAALAGLTPALFYVGTARYYLVFWLFTLLVVAAWVGQEGWPMLRRRCPAIADPIRRHPAIVAADRMMGRLERWVGAK